MFNYNFLLLTCSVWQWSAWTMWTSLLKWCCQCLVNIKQIKKNSACLCLQAQMTKIPTFQLLCITIDITSSVCCIDFPLTPAPAGGHFGSIFHQNYIYYSYGRSGSGLFVLGFHKTQIKMVLDHTIYSLHDRWKMNIKKPALRNANAQHTRNCLNAVIAEEVTPVLMLILPQVLLRALVNATFFHKEISWTIPEMHPSPMKLSKFSSINC